MTTYACSLLRSKERTIQSTLSEVDDMLQAEDYSLWGRFVGLFGLASNELILVTYGSVDSINESLQSLSSVGNASSLLLQPTVRPTEDRERTREGLYVFRTFDIYNRDVDEVAALSLGAWPTFEGSDQYAAEPQALFCQSDLSAEQGTMLLVTWYDGLNSWQASRQQGGKAGENFGGRAQLTLSTRATATRLVV